MFKAITSFINTIRFDKIAMLTVPNLYISIFLQDSALLEIRRELQERPTTRLVDDLRKKVKILQVHKMQLTIGFTFLTFVHMHSSFGFLYSV